MSTPPSGPMSDYDFAEIPDQIPEPEPADEIVNNILVQRIDPSIRSILGGFALDDEVLERIANSNISYGQLSALDNDDLNSLGITDHETQEEILAEFRSLENQDVHLEALLRALNDPLRAERHEASVIDMIQNQLMSMNTLLAATILKIGTSKSIQSPGIVINNKFASPDAVMSMLQQMTTHAEAMMKLIKKLKNEADIEKRDDPKDKLKGIALRSFLIVSGIVLSFCIFKQLRIGSRF